MISEQAPEEDVVCEWMTCQIHNQQPAGTWTNPVSIEFPPAAAPMGYIYFRMILETVFMG